jgi:hypothetical protein
MATHAQTQALVVVENLRSQLKGRLPESVYHQASVPRISCRSELAAAWGNSRCWMARPPRPPWRP